MEAKAPQRELKGCPKAAQRPPKGSKMDPTGSTHASVLASMGPNASRRTPWRQKGTKKLPKVRQKVTFSHQKLDAEAVPKTSKSRLEKKRKGRQRRKENVKGNRRSTNSSPTGVVSNKKYWKRC